MSDTPDSLNDGTFFDTELTEAEVRANNPAVVFDWQPDGTGN